MDMQRNGNDGQQNAPLNMAEVAYRGAALLYDLQMDVARSVLQTHARTASLFGAPDYSAWFRVADDRARRVFSESVEQMLAAARQVTSTVAQIQRELGRVAEQQTIVVTEELRQNVQQLGERTEEGFEQIRNVAQQQVDQAQAALDSARSEQQREQQASPQREAKPQHREATSEQTPAAPSRAPDARQSAGQEAPEIDLSESRGRRERPSGRA